MSLYKIFAVKDIDGYVINLKEAPLSCSGDTLEYALESFIDNLEEKIADLQSVLETVNKYGLDCVMTIDCQEKL